MTHLLRRLRGIIAAAVSWAVMWLPVGIVLLLIGRTRDFAPSRIVGFLSLWEAWGALSGAIFAVVLAVAERNHSLADLSLLRVSAWGAIGAMVLPVLLTVLALLRWSSLPPYDWSLIGVVLAVCATLGGVCAAVTFAIAQRAPSV